MNKILNSLGHLRQQCSRLLAEAKTIAEGKRMLNSIEQLEANPAKRNQMNDSRTEKRKC